MSRSGYVEDDGSDDDQRRLAMWRGAVASAMRGKRGQTMLIDLLAALDAMPEKRLIANDFSAEGSYCTLGALGAVKGLELRSFGDSEGVNKIALAQAFDVASPLVAEIMYENDEGGLLHYDEKAKRYERETPEQRWTRMRQWVAGQIKTDPAHP